MEVDATIDTLNGEPFVDNYVWDPNEEFLSIVGRKEFMAPVGEYQR